MVKYIVESSAVSTGHECITCTNHLTRWHWRHCAGGSLELLVTIDCSWAGSVQLYSVGVDHHSLPKHTPDRPLQLYSRSTCGGEVVCVTCIVDTVEIVKH